MELEHKALLGALEAHSPPTAEADPPDGVPVQGAHTRLRALKHAARAVNVVFGLGFVAVCLLLAHYHFAPDLEVRTAAEAAALHRTFPQTAFRKVGLRITHTQHDAMGDVSFKGWLWVYHPPGAPAAEVEEVPAFYDANDREAVPALLDRVSTSRGYGPGTLLRSEEVAAVNMKASPPPPPPLRMGGQRLDDHHSDPHAENSLLKR